MAKKLALVNGVPRMVDESASPTIYDESLIVVDGTPGSGEIEGPITSGTPITLPSSQTYDSAELQIYLNGARLTDVLDYNYEGSTPRTQISFTFEIVPGDIIRFRIDRGI